MLEEDCTGHYTKSTDCICTEHKHLKVIYFRILTEIIEYLKTYSLLV